MTDQISIATRKGLLRYRRDAGVWRHRDTAFIGSPVSISLDIGRKLFVALNLGHFGMKLHRSDDDGTTWKELDPPRFPKADASKRDEAADGAKPPAVSAVWALASGRDGEIWCGTTPGGLFHSRDNGENWRLVESLWNMPERARWVGGGTVEPALHSIMVDPRDPDRVTVAVSCGGAWQTGDGGKTWSIASTGMIARYMPPELRNDPVIQDPHLVVQCAAAPEVFWCQHHNGIFRSVDGSQTWSEITAPVSSFGFAVAVHPRNPDIAWFAPAKSDQDRVPVDGKVVVTRTEDGGKTFDVFRRGLPQENAFDLVYRHAMAIDDSGKRLAMGSTTGNLWVSEDSGESWTPLSTQLPPIYAVRFG
jgi:photosystem II stability/assembly factor-like uncharacterized protein